LPLLSLLSLLSPRGSAASSCPSGCVCASNLLSCSRANLSTVPSPLPRFCSVLDLSHNNVSRLRGDWAPARLPHLHTLLLSHNGLAFVSTEAFGHVPRLRHLDLSSNRLRALDENLFSALGELEVLLLYNNEISTVDRTAFEDLARLRKLYLGRNRIARFPLELLREGSRLPQLALLDLSANRLRSVPSTELQALPAWLRDRLYLHDNPLACDCPLYQLLARGHRRHLSAVVDFQEELRCFPQGAATAVTVLGAAGKRLLNCSEAKEAVLEAHLGDSVTLGCDSRWQGVRSRHWVTPAGDKVAAGDSGGNGSVALLANGSLELRELRAEDAGTYACWVSGPAANETLYVELLVHNFTLHGPHDTLNTAYTTLVGCILSVVLVLIYLYLTPCRCCCCRGGAEKAAGPRDDSINSSVLSTTPNHGEHGGGRVPEGQAGGPGQNGRFKGGGTPPLPPRQGPKAQRKVSDPDSVSSVFSDTPIVV
ncbi:AMGO1 protein, partial [Neodrepanis coruscans]|nr:AMGO1 protein [Neodrepanis coruscans]